jgi:glycerophosphoryl diester phosphodiesterase
MAESTKVRAARGLPACALIVVAGLTPGACSFGSDTPGDGTPDSTWDGTPVPILIAHRGASAYAPEHTIASYELGIEQGADYIEPDLQITSDGVLIALHDLTLERTTNVEDVFPDRFQEIEVRGAATRVWPANDFTLEEIRTLDAGSWFDPSFAGALIPTFREVAQLARGRAGLFIETKAPEVYGDLGHDMESQLLSALAELGLGEPGQDQATPIIIQSFSAASLELLRYEHGTRLPLTLLVSGEEAAAEWLSPDGLARAAEFATGIGPAKNLLMADPAVVDRAHEVGLTVVPWTFRARNPGDDFTTVEVEMAHFLEKIGVDGLFTDNPDLFPRAPAGGGS